MKLNGNSLRTKALFDNVVNEEEFDWNLKDVIELIRDYINSPSFARFLSLRTVISLGRVCKSFHNLFNANYIEKVILLGNLNKTLRLQFWAFKAPWLE